MDFDFGNLIYIIATLVAILVGVLGKKKKPAPGAPPGGSGQKEKGNIFDFLGKELEGYMENNRDSQAPVYEESFENGYSDGFEESIQASEVVPDIYQSYDEGNYNPEAQLNRVLIEREGRSSSAPLEVIELDEDQGQDYFDVVMDFNLESAVIYSAVINRIEY